ncbi:ABC transporter permease, partial [Pediococcus acidilactici]
MENLNKDFTLVGSKGSDSTEKIAKPALSFFQDAWRRFKKNKVALVAMWIIAITLFFSVISAFVVPQSKAN